MNPFEARARPVLLGGFSPDLANWLQRRFRALPVRSATTADEAFEEVRQSEWSLVVVNDPVPPLSVQQFLQRLQSELQRAELPLLACVAPGTTSEHSRRLVQELGVRQILYQPVDREELARQIAAVLQIALPPEEKIGRPDRAGLSQLWERFRGTSEQRLDLLEEATLAALEGKLDAEGQRAAEREAHKFAGSIGTFGFMEASRLGREVESVFAAPRPVDQSAAVRLADLLVAIRSDLERTPLDLAPEEPPSAEAPGHPVVVMMTRDRPLAEDMAKEAAGRGMELAVVSTPDRVREWIARSLPLAVLLDLPADPVAGSGVWELLEELAAREPPLPALVLSEQGSFADRIEVARRGGRGFLERPVSASRVLDLAAAIVQETSLEGRRVLSVDDDPAVLATLRSILEPQGLRVQTLDDPLQFWDALEETAPDLLVLDVEMPRVSGIELCRVVRGDPRRGDLAILFLTARTDSETVQRIFSAGADDYASKPIIPAELLGRIRGRLERLQLQRRLSDTDSLTGLNTRRKSEEILERFLRLAERQGQPLSLAVLDLDRFKRINDQYGHAMGDTVLRRMGQLLQRAFRGEDVVARWGGEEFVVGMYGAAREDAVRRIHELLEMLNRDEFHPPGDAALRVSFSAGVATYPADGGDVHALYRAADAALLEAKSLGRARVVPAGSGGEAEATTPSSAVDIVLVEDDDALGSLLVHTLEARGYRTRWIRDGQEALEALGGGEPALRAPVLLLDIDLPGLDGLAVLRSLAQVGALGRMRVIMLTLRSGEAEVYKSLDLGAFDHVGKPFSIPVLLQRIRRALEA